MITIEDLTSKLEERIEELVENRSEMCEQSIADYMEGLLDAYEIVLYWIKQEENKQ